MSNRLIKDQVVTRLKAVTKLAVVTEDPNLLSPTFAECPAAIVSYDTPWLTANPIAMGSYRLRWNFVIDILISPTGVGNLEEWVQLAEPIPALLIAQFAAHSGLSGTATSFVFDNNFQKPTILPTYRETQYFGFTWKLGVFEMIETTFAP